MPYGIRGSANGHQKCDLRMISRDLTVGKEAMSNLNSEKENDILQDDGKGPMFWATEVDKNETKPQVQE